MKLTAVPKSAKEAHEQLRELFDHKAKLQAEHDEIGEWDSKIAIYFCSSEERQRLSFEQSDLKERIAVVERRITELNVFLKHAWADT